MKSSVNEAEIKQFTKDAPRWWDEEGPFAPLHALNPVRIAYIKEQICDHFGRDYTDAKALKGLNALDIGCGGGLVCEPLARMGAKVTGADADTAAIEVAKDHAAGSGLEITYLNQPAEDIKQTYDIVLALEIIEHVDSPQDFVKTCAARLKPGGLIIFSTLNRTMRSMALGVIAAEYILGWVPKGTHSWKKFVRPSELARYARATDLSPKDISGLIYNPAAGFKISKTDTSVNYFMTGMNKN